MPLSISRKITLVVLFVHALFLGMILFGPALLVLNPPRKPLVVKTIVPKTVAPSVQPAKQQAIAKPSPRQQPSVSAQAPVTKPQPAPQTKPAASRSQPTPKKAPPVMDKTLNKKGGTVPVKQNPPDNRAKISEQLKKELQDSIAKIDGKKQVASSKQMRSATPVLTPITLHIDDVSFESSSDLPSDYPDLLVSSLHQSLHLPEFGEVKIQLTLHQDGHVVKLVVLKAESEKNKRYLEGSLAQLQLPSFIGSFAKKKEHTFILTFCSEI